MNTFVNYFVIPLLVFFGSLTGVVLAFFTASLLYKVWEKTFGD